MAALATPAPVTLDRTGRRAVELAARTYHAALVKLRERAAELAATLATHGTRAEPAELARVLADAGLTLDDLPADVVDQLGAGQHR